MLSKSFSKGVSSSVSKSSILNFFKIHAPDARRAHIPDPRTRIALPKMCAAKRRAIASVQVYVRWISIVSSRPPTWMTSPSSVPSCSKWT